MRSIILVCVVVGVASALNCYQGIQNASQPISGSATSCPTPSLSCLKTYDNSTNTVSRSCQTTNCTLNGVVSSTGFCQNTTSYPYQTMTQNYISVSNDRPIADGCNGAQAYSSIVLRLGWFVVPVLAVIGYSTK